MTALPDANERAPSQDPATYGAPRLLSRGFWFFIGLGVVGLASAVIFVILTPRLTAPRLAASPVVRALPIPTAPVQIVAPPTAAGPAGLEDRVRRLEANQARLASAAEEALAAASLNEAADGPRPFTGELNAFSGALVGSPDLRALYPLAAQGAPTRVVLAADLTGFSSRVAAAAARPSLSAGFVAQLSYALSRVVSIRRVEAVGPGPEADLLRAQQRANLGDLEGAVSIIDALPAAAREPLAPWRDSARRRLEIDGHISGLRVHALADLAAARAPPP